MGSRTSWLLVIVVAGLTLFALSFVEGWLVHNRILLGEGYRDVRIDLSAWRGRGMPVLTLAALLALGTAVVASAIAWRRSSMPPMLLLVGSVATLALIASGAWPIDQAAHASAIRVSPGWLLLVAALLGVAMVVAALKLTTPPRPLLIGVVALALVMAVGGASGRWLGLQWAEGTGRHWQEGSYVRARADSGELTLTIDDGHFTVGDRWSGTWEASGLTVILDDDPACPDSRGAYHAHSEGDDDLRFVKLVDTCADGARAADLEAVIWERQP